MLGLRRNCNDTAPRLVRTAPRRAARACSHTRAAHAQHTRGSGSGLRRRAARSAASRPAHRGRNSLFTSQGFKRRLDSIADAARCKPLHHVFHAATSMISGRCRHQQAAFPLTPQAASCCPSNVRPPASATRTCSAAAPEQETGCVSRRSAQGKLYPVTRTPSHQRAGAFADAEQGCSRTATHSSRSRPHCDAHAAAPHPKMQLSEAPAAAACSRSRHALARLAVSVRFATGAARTSASAATAGDGGARPAVARGASGREPPLPGLAP
jgi:hypothetical protein